MSWATKKELQQLKSLLKKIKIEDEKGNDIYNKLNVLIVDSDGTTIFDKQINNGTIHEMIDYYISAID